MGRILVAEDDDSTRNLVKMTLEVDGHTVDSVADGIAAIRAMEGSAGGNDLLLLGIMLPGADGYEVFRQVKSGVVFKTAEKRKPQGFIR